MIASFLLLIGGKMDEKLDYIASQNIGGIDEIALSVLKLNADRPKGKPRPLIYHGKPGRGKTECSLAVAKVLNLPYGNISVSNEDTIYKFTGMPLIINGETIMSDSLTLQSMESGGILYLDEIDQMAKSVQKGLSSLMDHRQSLTVLDGVKEKEITCKNDLYIIGAYNDSDHEMSSIFEQSFLNRCSEIRFSEIPEDYQDRS